MTFPQTRGYRSARPVTTSTQSLQRHERSAPWFQLYRRGGRVISHHGHDRAVLIRDWSTPMGGVEGTTRALHTAMHPEGPARDAADRHPRPEPGKPDQSDLAGSLPSPLGA